MGSSESSRSETLDLLHVQAFPWNGTGGGARITRFLMKEAPVSWSLLNTGMEPGTELVPVVEHHLSYRPWLGPLERVGRLHGWRSRLGIRLLPWFRPKLLAKVASLAPRCVHSVVCTDQVFSLTQSISEELGIPHVISVHDDLPRIDFRDDPEFDRAMGEVWQRADFRFVISDALGQCYNERYGEREFAVVTDGLSLASWQSRVTPACAMRIYFTGLMHLSYEPLVRDLLSALGEMKTRFPASGLVSRGGFLRPECVPGSGLFEFRTFEPDIDYVRDSDGFDYLFLPLPFDPAFRDFVRYSYSTKLVTYLSLGIPILYYGPEESAISRTLGEWDAAIRVCQPDRDALVRALESSPERRQAVVKGASRLASACFEASEVKARFFTTILRVTDGGGQ